MKNKKTVTPAVPAANSKQSTGLKTGHGKEASKVNAVQHGVRPLEHRPEPGNSGISESPRSAVADPEKDSPRRECTKIAESQVAEKVAANSNGESTSTKDPSSPPSSPGPAESRETEGKLDPSFEAELASAFGTSNLYLCHKLLLQVAQASPQEPGDRRGMSILAALAGISARDPLEGMFVAQIVSVHNQAMEYLRRATLAGLPHELVGLYVNLATKLLRTYGAQMEALDHRRGKGAPKMNAEQVHIDPGAQDIVGPVSRQNSFDTSAENHGKSKRKSNGHHAAASKGMVEEWESAR